ncbi:alpha/beta hydrolase family protein [Chondromyces crocatus]|uniref:Serine aminopeptidase S33 domain-containing protein n=1 Tax=Chondromyces crocatus TaxID=52 RepID=A0A0K1EPE3_CHOCO|nr:alpha/beta fold hydrolase [Chondromyces crocatus]AKT42679.1 uncharacterized protein CMC5_069060 [Chondromyces crocatus]
MQRFGLPVLGSLLLVSTLACGSNDDEHNPPPNDGDGGAGGAPVADEVTRTSWRDESGLVQVLLTTTLHPDGTRTLHGETVLDLSRQYLGETAHVTLVEDVVLAADGRLVTADLRRRAAMAAKIFEHRLEADARAGTLVATRSSGRVELDLDTDPAWLVTFLPFSPLVPFSAPSGVACATMEGAVRASAEVMFLDANPMGSLPLLLQGAGDGEHPSSLRLMDNLCGYDPSNGTVRTLASNVLGELRADSDAPAHLVPALDINRGDPVIARQQCDAPARFETFEILADDGSTLAGQIDLPPGTGPFPVVSFHAGSGGIERTGNYFGVPQWTCLAQALVDAGIAVVRYDDPGHGESPGDFAALSYEDRDAHALAVSRYAAAHPLVRTDAVFALGHSEGGNHVSRAALAQPELRGLIQVAGVAMTGAEIVEIQAGRPYENAGYSQQLVNALEQQVRVTMNAIRDGSLPDDQLPAGTSRAFWVQFLDADGVADAVAAARPTLVLQGVADWQVPPRNADLFEDALNAAGVDVQVERYPYLGHMMTPNTPGFEGIGEEYGLPLTFAPEVVEHIVTWVTAQASVSN